MKPWKSLTLAIFIAVMVGMSVSAHDLHIHKAEFLFNMIWFASLGYLAGAATKSKKGTDKVE